MLGSSHLDSALPALGMISLVLGVIALLLFFLPVLGIPLSLCGLLLGTLGLFTSRTRRNSLRWSLAGVGASLLALGINVAINYASAGYLHDQTVPPPWRTVPDRPFSPPPASQL